MTQSLKSVSVDQIQKAIANALTGLTGKNYTVSISALNFDNPNSVNKLDDLAGKVTFAASASEIKSEGWLFMTLLLRQQGLGTQLNPRLAHALFHLAHAAGGFALELGNGCRGIAMTGFSQGILPLGMAGKERGE